MFYTITNLQGSQTPEKAYSSLSCFTPLQTYKVLKPTMGQTPEEKRFTPLQTYKVLKRYAYVSVNLSVLHHYKLTRFSNTLPRSYKEVSVLHHYKLTRFSNTTKVITEQIEFYTITNLQGSQTLVLSKAATR